MDRERDRRGDAATGFSNGESRVLGWRVVLAVALFLLICVPASALARDFDNPASNNPDQQFTPGSVQRDDTPNDPSYDAAEPDDEDGGTATNLYDERFDLFGFPAAQTSGTLNGTRYREGPHGPLGADAVNPLGDPQVSGFNAAGAWKLERGRPDAVVAILDTGIKWDRESLRLQIHLNTDELPTPASKGATCTGSNPYDCNDDGAVTVADYAGTTVSPAAGPHGDPAKIDAEDLIATYSEDTDTDANGYVDDIAGWDFFDNDNNPFDASSYFAASNHGSARATNAAERGNDGAGEIGVCPGCQVMPIRIWDTFVSDGNTFGMGILYGTDNGASVIEGANGSVYHSAFAEAASQYAYDEGVVQTYSGDDLNTANHNYPGNYGHAMLIQGTVPDTVGIGTDAGPEFQQAFCDNQVLIPANTCLGSQLPVGTYFRGANTTQFGGKSSIALEGATGSENTGKAAGAAALVISAGRNATPVGAAPPRRDSRDPRADRRARHRGSGQPAEQRRRPRSGRPRRRSGRPARGSVDLSLRLGPGRPRPRGQARPERQGPTGGRDQLARLVRAADRRSGRRQGHGAGTVRRRRRPVRLGARMGRRAEPHRRRLADG